MKVEDIIGSNRPVSKRRKTRGSRNERPHGIDFLQLDENPTEYYIGYHGTDAKFDQFDRKFSAMGTHWFADNPEVIRQGESGAAGRDRIIKAKLHIKNPAGWKEYDKYVLDQLEAMGYDGLILDDNYVVFDDDQIEILEVM